jgi:hypothetical protein
LKALSLALGASGFFWFNDPLQSTLTPSGHILRAGAGRQKPSLNWTIDYQGQRFEKRKYRISSIVQARIPT